MVSPQQVSSNQLQTSVLGLRRVLWKGQILLWDGGLRYTIMTCGVSRLFLFKAWVWMGRFVWSRRDLIMVVFCLWVHLSLGVFLFGL